MNKVIILLVAVIGLGALIVASLSFKNNQPQTNSTVISQPVVSPSNTGSNIQTGTKTYTMNDVAVHKTTSSCWSVVNGKVYDLTSWISQHPGGSEVILGMCGVDGSSAYAGQHGNQRRPANELAGFLIGDLTN